MRMIDRTTPIPEPPPYADADFHWTDDGFEIRFAVKDPCGILRRFGLLGFVLLLIGGGLIAWGFADADGGRGLAVAGVVIGCAGGAVLPVVGMTAALKGFIIFDGRTLFIGPARDSGYRLPLDELKGLRLHRRDKQARAIALSAPPGQRMTWRRLTNVEAITDLGVVRVLDTWDDKELEWAVDVVNQILGLTPLAARDDARRDPEPAVLVTQNTVSLNMWLFFTACAAAATLGLAVWLGSDVKRGYESSTWPSVEGLVLEANAEIDEPAIRYRYEVAGVAYEGHEISPTSLSRSAQEQTVAEYREGATVEVFYNPEQVNDAVLVTGWRVLDLMLLVLVTLFGGGGTLWIATKRPTAAMQRLRRRYVVEPDPAGRRREPGREMGVGTAEAGILYVVWPLAGQMMDWLDQQGVAYPADERGRRPTPAEVREALAELPELAAVEQGLDADGEWEVELSCGEGEDVARTRLRSVNFRDINEPCEIAFLDGDPELVVRTLYALSARTGPLVLAPDAGDPAVVLWRGRSLDETLRAWGYTAEPG